MEAKGKDRSTLKGWILPEKRRIENTLKDWILSEEHGIEAHCEERICM